MKAHFRVIVAVLFIATATAVYATSIRMRSVTVDVSSLRLEIADEDAERVQGLSGRESLEANAGMLFVFAEAGLHPFWMKDMRFPIDIIWINDNVVQEVVTLPPSTPGDLLPPRHTPTHFADAVLELNAGQAKELGLVPGVKMILPAGTPQ